MSNLKRVICILLSMLLITASFSFASAENSKAKDRPAQAKKVGKSSYNLRDPLALMESEEVSPQAVTFEAENIKRKKESERPGQARSEKVKRPLAASEMNTLAELAGEDPEALRVLEETAMEDASIVNELVRYVDDVQKEDRYIVKYKQGHGSSFKDKTATEVRQFVALEQESLAVLEPTPTPEPTPEPEPTLEQTAAPDPEVTLPSEQPEAQDTTPDTPEQPESDGPEMQGYASPSPWQRFTSAVAAPFRFMASILSPEENVAGKQKIKAESQVELIVLNEKVRPEEFAGKLKELGADKDIEYIQPDFELSLQTTEEEQQTEDTPPAPETTPEVEPAPSQTVEPTVDPTPTPSPTPEPTPTPEATPTPEPTPTPTITPTPTPTPVQMQTVVVAIIDTGIDMGHERLLGRGWANPLETENGLDDDGNGYVDDLYGYNFADGNSVLFNESYPLSDAHGTMIAGIVAKETEGIDVVIMPLKVFSGGNARTSDIIAAIEYATANGAQVINCSFGSKQYNLALEQAIADSGALIVSAAGNARTNIADEPVYPACFDLPNVISVGSLNADGGLSYYSNYSRKELDIAALGREVNSALPNNEHGKYSGTSMSAGFVTSAAAAVLAREPLTAKELKARLLSSADKLSNLQSTVIDGNRLNIENALAGVDGGAVANTPADDFNVDGYGQTPEEDYALFSQSKIKDIRIGTSHVLILMDNGTVWAGGSNTIGQLGLGSSYTGNPIPLTQVVGLADIAAISVRNSSNLVIKNDGTVWGWGNNTNGEIGDGTTTNRYVPVQTIGLNDITSVEVGSLAIRNDGTLWSWSSDNGTGTTAAITSTSPVQLSSMINAIGISVGYDHKTILRSDGSVWSWGNNSNGQLGDNTNTKQYSPIQAQNLNGISKISSGNYFTLALKPDGTVWAWGLYGNVGNASNYSRIPVKLDNLSNVTDINAKSRSFAKSDGTVWDFNRLRYTDSGNGIFTSSQSYYAIQRPNVYGATSLSNDSLGLARNNEKFWGQGAYGLYDYNILDKLNIFKPYPTEIKDFIQVYNGKYHSEGLKADGTVWRWGSTEYDQLVTYPSFIANPQQINGISNITSISSGDYHLIALKQDGTVWSMGNNGCGQLGNGTFANQTSPVQVQNLSGITSISAGNTHNFALKSDGTVWAWGRNFVGFLGDGTETDQPIPVKVQNLTNIIAISAGREHNLALKSDGTVWAWGNNNYGELGDGTREIHSLPAKVNNLSGVVKISSSQNYHSLALKSDGTVWAWGNNSNGQLGNPSVSTYYNYSVVPVQASNLMNITDIYAGSGWSIAQQNDGSIWEWGACPIGGGSTRSPILSSIKDARSLTESGLLKPDGNFWRYGVNNYYIGITAPQLLGAFDDYSNKATSPHLVTLDSTNSATIIGTMNNSFDSDWFKIVPTTNFEKVVQLDSNLGKRVLVLDNKLNNLSQTSSGAYAFEANKEYYLAVIQDQSVFMNGPQSYTLTIGQSSTPHPLPFYTIALQANEVDSFANVTYKVTYNPAELQLLDFNAQTALPQMAVDLVPGTDIEILSHANGVITFKVNKTVPAGQTYSGLLAAFKFKPLGPVSSPPQFTVQ